MHRYSDPKQIKGRKGKPVKYFYTRRYDTVTKTQRWVSTGQKTRRAATDWVEARRHEEALGEREADRPQTKIFRDAFQLWILQKKRLCRSPAYIETLEFRTWPWLKTFGATPLREITKEDVWKFLEKRRTRAFVAKPKTRRKKPLEPLSAATMATEQRNLQGLFNFCIEEEWLDRNPLPKIKAYGGTTRPRIKTLTPEQEADLIHACRTATKVEVHAIRNAGGRRGGKATKSKSTFEQTAPPPPHLAPLMIVALNTGFRRRTLLSLCWRHLDTKRKRWRIPGELFKIQEHYEAPVAAVVLAELARYRTALREECIRKGAAVLRRLGPDAPVFGLKPDSSVLTGLKSAATRAGLEGLTLHDCLRIFINKCRRAGVPEDRTMALSAHKDLRTVHKSYREVSNEEKLEAIQRLDAAGGDGKIATRVSE